MKVTQISIGRFHHFHLARQLEKKKLLDSIWTGYPKFKLKDEQGIPQEKLKTFPWVHTPYMFTRGSFLSKFSGINKHWRWLDAQSLDYYISKKMCYPTILVALSGGGLYSGRKVKSLGGFHICDRGSTHIEYQNEILREEYNLLGVKYDEIDPRMIEKEILEYENADFITVPSETVKRSFIEKGVLPSKIVKIPYGARLDRFQKIGNPSNQTFRVLWVGGVSVRKGFLYALRAFNNLKTKNKEFIVIGSIENQIKPLISRFDTSKVRFLGQVSNKDLSEWYSTSHAFVLTSLEEGLSMVQGEALACGCPVICSTNTGGEDLVIDGKTGIITPIRDVDAITDALALLLDNPILRQNMSEEAIKSVQNIGGWDKYGDSWEELIQSRLDI